MTLRIPLTQLAHEAVQAQLNEGAIAVDATAGTGRDALFLAQSVGTSGHVYVFDVQKAALEQTRQRLEEEGVLSRATLLLAGHQDMETLLPVEAIGKVSAVLFNLGYLPGGDHSLTTSAETTLRALESALRVLRPGGVLSVLCYRGHEAGAAEYEAVMRWANGLGERVFQLFWQGGDSETTARPSPRLLSCYKV